MNPTPSPDAIPAPRRSPSGSWRRRLILVAVSIVATIGLAELGLRVVASMTDRERGIVFHPEFGWKMLPGVTKRSHEWGGDKPTRINAQGWRGAEFALQPPVGKTRIAVVGDSFTFGVGVNREDRFGEILQRSQPEIEVLNFGMNASGTDQHLRIVTEEVCHYRPTAIVLISFLDNDLFDIRNEYKSSWPKPYFELSEDRLHLVRPRKDLALWFRTSTYLGELIHRVLPRNDKNTVVAARWKTADTVPLYLALVARMHEVANAAGAKLLTCLVYPRERRAGSPSAVESRVRKGLVALGLPILDTLDAFAQRATASQTLYLKDGHWNPAGNQLFAQLLASRLQELGW